MIAQAIVLASPLTVDLTSLRTKRCVLVAAAADDAGPVAPTGAVTAAGAGSGAAAAPSGPRLRREFGYAPRTR